MVSDLQCALRRVKESVIQLKLALLNQLHLNTLFNRLFAEAAVNQLRPKSYLQFSLQFTNRPSYLIFQKILDSKFAELDTKPMAEDGKKCHRATDSGPILVLDLGSYLIQLKSPTSLLVASVIVSATIATPSY